MTAFGCACGFSTKSAAAEAKHRHNFPALCRRRRVPSDALYVYDCDRGQGAVRAKTLRSAVAKAAAEAGSADSP